MTVSEIAPSDLTKVWEKECLGLFLQPQLSTLLGPGMLYLKVKVTNHTDFYFSCFSYKSWGFRFVINPPGMAYCGFRMVNPPTDIVKSGALKVKALKALSVYLNDAFPNATFDLRIEPADMEIDSIPNFDITHVTHSVLDISIPEADLLAQFSGRRKRNIKKQSKGYEVDTHPNIEEVMKLLEHTFRKSGSDKLRSFYKQGLIGEMSFMKANLVLSEGRPLATNVMAYDGAVAYYFAGGIDPEPNDANAGTISMWSAIREAKQAGLKTLNFCGSSIPSISGYFKSFRGDEIKLICLKKGNPLVEKLKKLKGVD